MKTLNFFITLSLLGILLTGCNKEGITPPNSNKLGIVVDGIISFDSDVNVTEAYNKLKNGINPSEIIEGYENFKPLSDYYSTLESWLENETNLDNILKQNRALFFIGGNEIEGFEILRTIRSPYFSQLVNYEGFIMVGGKVNLYQYDKTYSIDAHKKAILLSKDLMNPEVRAYQNEHIEIESTSREVCTQQGDPPCHDGGNNRRVRTALTVTNLLAFAAIDSQVKAQRRNGIGFWVEETAERVELNSDVTFTESGSPGCPCTDTDIFNQVVFNNDEIHHEVVSYGGTPQVIFTVNDAVVRGEIRKCSGTFVRECTITVI